MLRCARRVEQLLRVTIHWQRPGRITARGHGPEASPSVESGLWLILGFCQGDPSPFSQWSFLSRCLATSPREAEPRDASSHAFYKGWFPVTVGPVSDVRSSFSGAGSLRGFISPFLPVTCAAAVGRKGISPTGAEFRASFFFVFTSPNGYEECQKCPFYIVLPTVVGYQGGRRHRDAIGGTGCEMLACLDQPRDSLRRLETLHRSERCYSVGEAK